MRWESILEIVGAGAVLTTRRLREAGFSAAECSRQLGRWTDAGRLLQVQRGVYVLAPAYRPRGPHPFELAVALRDNSYVSLGSALRHHGVTQASASRVVGAISTRRARTLGTPWGDVNYRRLAPHRFRLPPETDLEDGLRVRIASPEQALCETVFFTLPVHRESIVHMFTPEAATRLDPAAAIEAAAVLRDADVMRIVQGFLRQIDRTGPLRARPDR